MKATAAQASPPTLEVFFGQRKKALSYLQAVWLETWYGMNQIPSAKIVLAGRHHGEQYLKQQADEVQHCQPGAEVAIKIKAGPVLFAGLVVEQRLELRVGRWELTLKLKHRLQGLTASYRSQVFEKQSDADIVRGLLSAQGVELSKLDGMRVKHAQMVQFGCSDWQFLKARLNANGVWLMPRLDKVAIIKPVMGATRHTLRASDSSAQTMILEEAVLQLSNQSQPTGIEVSSWNIKKQKMSDAAKGKAFQLGQGGLDPSKLKALSKTPWSMTRSLSLAVDEQHALAEARLLAQQASGVRARFTLMGSTAYELGDTLILSGFGKHFDGAGMITEVSHKISKDQWRTTIALGLNPASEADAAVVPETMGLHIGIIDSYQTDPDGLNRLRVKMPALKLDNKPLWARFAMPYASKDSGLCFYPEVGDEVVLGFFDADPRYPVILGAMHNPKNKAPFAPSKDNIEKAMVFVNGEAKQLLLFNMKEALVRIDNHGKESIALKGGIQIEGDERLSVNAKKVVLKASQTAEVQAQQDIKLESKKGIAAAAPKVDVNAKTQLTLQGSAGVKIKGAMVDLSN